MAPSRRKGDDPLSPPDLRDTVFQGARNAPEELVSFDDRPTLVPVTKPPQGTPAEDEDDGELTEDSAPDREYEPDHDPHYEWHKEERASSLLSRAIPWFRYRKPTNPATEDDPQRDILDQLLDMDGIEPDREIRQVRLRPAARSRPPAATPPVVSNETPDGVPMEFPSEDSIPSTPASAEARLEEAPPAAPNRAATPPTLILPRSEAPAPSSPSLLKAFEEASWRAWLAARMPSWKWSWPQWLAALWSAKPIDLRNEREGEGLEELWFPGLEALESPTGKITEQHTPEITLPKEAWADIKTPQPDEDEVSGPIRAPASKKKRWPFARPAIIPALTGAFTSLFEPFREDPGGRKTMEGHPRNPHDDFPPPRGNGRPPVIVNDRRSRWPAFLAGGLVTLLIVGCAGLGGYALLPDRPAGPLPDEGKKVVADAPATAEDKDPRLLTCNPKGYVEDGVRRETIPVQGHVLDRETYLFKGALTETWCMREERRDDWERVTNAAAIGDSDVCAITHKGWFGKEYEEVDKDLAVWRTCHSPKGPITNEELGQITSTDWTPVPGHPGVEAKCLCVSPGACKRESSKTVASTSER